MNCGCCFGSCIRSICCCGKSSCRDQTGIEFPMNFDALTVCHAAILELNTPLDRNTMTGAWFKTLQKHPFLRAKWNCGFIAKVKENTEPTYLQIQENEKLLDQFKAHSNKDAKYAELTVCEQGLTIQILVTIPHSLADGTSMMIILNDLLKFYESPHLSAVLDEEYPLPDLKLKPELTAEATKNFQTRIVEEQKLFKNVVPHQPFTKREPGPTNVTIGAGTPDGARKLLHFCRKNKITIGTYLMASFNFINSRVTKKLGNELRLDLDYNLRDRFPKQLGNTVVACYIGVGSISPKADFEETIVDVAKRVKSEINQQLENQEPFMIKELIAVSDGKDFNNPENNYIASSANFSNVGKYKFDTQLNFGKIKELYCSGKNWNKPYEYGLLFQSTDRLCITLTHPDMAVYNETASAYLQGLIDVAESPELYGDMTLRKFANL